MSINETGRPSPGRDSRLARKAAVAVTVVGTLVLGGAAVAASLAGPATVAAQSGTASPATSPAASTVPGPGWAGGRGGPGGGGLGPSHEAVTDTSVAAKAIGISEADLTAALATGQTMAQVAKTHNVDVQKVIDALVQDGLDELAAAVKSGQLTQAPADAQKAEVTQRATAQVNGTFTGPSH